MIERTGRRRGAVGGLVLALGAVLAGTVAPWSGPGNALGHEPTPVLGGGLLPADAVLGFRWGGSPPAAIRASVLAAAGDLGATRRSRAATFTLDPGAGSVVAYGDGAPCGVHGLACFRRSAPSWFGLWLRERGHRFDWGTLRWCELSSDVHGCYDARTIVLDELGHVLGLEHHRNCTDASDYLDSVVQAVSRPRPQPGWRTHALGRCDVATLQAALGVDAWATRYSTCLAVPVRIVLSASRTVVPAGGTVRLEARLATAGAGALAENPLPGRIVVLQGWSAAGWSDLVRIPDAAEPGAYAVALAVRTDLLLRAIVRADPGEGLLPAATATLRVDVEDGCAALRCPLVGAGR